MKIALDTHCLYVTQAGTARYVRGLLDGFQALNAPGLEIMPLAWEVENFGFQQPQRALRTFYREFIWARWIAPRLLKRSPVDLLHRSAPSLSIRIPHGMPQIVTLHDLAMLRHPERYRPWQRASGEKKWREVALADRVICDSQFTANEAMELLKIAASNLEVVLLGVGKSPATPDAEILPDLPATFFLFVGSLEPGKNLTLLRDCYLLAEQRGEVLPPLFIVGARWSGVGNEGRPPKDWHYLGRQPDAVLFYLYQRAYALLFPSKYEGFGFPPLEAMTQGCPVICGRVASLPEVCGEAAEYAELQPENYLQAMQRLLADSARRDELIANGATQSVKFTWEKTAAQTYAVYQEVLR